MSHKIIIDLKNPSNLKSFHSKAKSSAKRKDVQVECNGTRITFSVTASFNKIKDLKEAAGSVINSCKDGGIGFSTVIALEGERPIASYAKDNQRMVQEG